MLKFSLIVPVYNVEKYIDKCLNSILKQSYDNYEVIIVNDGTKDNAQSIIDKYVNKDSRFKSFIKQNGGLSDARNYGLKHVKGDYIIFIDGDDFIENQLLFEINKYLEKNINIDIVKFQVNIVNEKGDLTEKVNGDTFDNVSPKDIFMTLSASKMFEPAWLYAFKTTFWKKNKFAFSKGKLHEDFGLIPYVIIKADHTSAIPYYGYNYVVRDNSIITSKGNDVRKANDVLFHFDHLLNLINEAKFDIMTKRIFNSFMANEIIQKARTLSGNDLDDYIKELKKRNVSNLLLDNTLPRKIKKLVVKLNIKFYIKRLMK